MRPLSDNRSFFNFKFELDPFLSIISGPLGAKKFLGTRRVWHVIFDIDDGYLSIRFTSKSIINDGNKREPVSQKWVNNWRHNKERQHFVELV